MERLEDIIADMDKWVEVVRRFNGDTATLSEFIKRIKLAYARKPESAAFEKEMLMYKTLLSKLLKYAFPQCLNCEDVCDSCEGYRLKYCQPFGKEVEDMFVERLCRKGS